MLDESGSRIGYRFLCIIKRKRKEIRMGTISHLEPTRVFTYFEEICQIPHGSRNLQKISDYFVNFAKEKNSFQTEKGKTGRKFCFIRNKKNQLFIKSRQISTFFFKQPV